MRKESSTNGSVVLPGVRVPLGIRSPLGSKNAPDDVLKNHGIMDLSAAHGDLSGSPQGSKNAPRTKNAPDDVLKNGIMDLSVMNVLDINAKIMAFEGKDVEP
ncbi:predicted protein [Histoplasma capsulatum var. duboisii H88]|uniref:Predicted protein n=1 Tax=Ajellomyces capsulatus (strain H88) TaxID=544711 RepID=F0U9Q4_AJEC8|nr:predicted protein [Histoplasma capsulatum var. duboisii H88]